VARSPKYIRKPMKTPCWRARMIILAVALAVPSPLVLLGCGSDSSSPPKDIGGLKTPSEVLKEAKAQGKAAKP
jgi:hypothetical protein